MIISEKIADVSGNLTFVEERDMVIDEASQGIIIQHLINTYEFPWKAVLKEVTSNAIDSHMRAGQTRPVEVTLPNSFSSNLVVQDWGVGMSYDELQIFNFGNSTKRDNNDDIGGFGIGAKAPLSIAATFTIRTVKDGLRNTIVIGQRSGLKPSMGFLEKNEPTTEPNNVRVIVPTTDREKFESAIAEGMFLGWAPGTLLIDGKDPGQSIHNNPAYREVGNGLGWLTVAQSSNPYGRYRDPSGVILLGPERYPLNWRELPDIPHTLRTTYLSDVVVSLEIGSVDMVRNREKLVYSAKTVRVLTARLNEIIAAGKEAYAELVRTAKSYREAYQAAQRAENAGFEGPYTYRGQTVGVKVPTLAPADTVFTYVTLSCGYNSELRQSKLESMRPSTYSRVRYDPQAHGLNCNGKSRHYVLVTNADKKMIAGVKDFAKHLEDHGGLHATQYTFMFSPLPLAELDPWFVAVHTKIIPGANFAQVTDKIRKERAAARRSGQGTARAGIRVKRAVINHSNYSTTHTVEEELGSLDTSKKYILLPTEGTTNHEHEMRKQLVNTRGGGYRVASSFYNGLLNLFEGADYEFLLTTKTTKVAEYKKVLKVVTLKGAVEEIMQAKLDALTPTDLAMKDVIAPQWVRYADDNSWAGVARQETVDLLKALQDTRKDTGAQRLIRHADTLSSYGLFTLNIPQPDGTVESPKHTLFARYPMLRVFKDYPNKADLEVAIEYINSVDFALETV